jgi:hypothetical protein
VTGLERWIHGIPEADLAIIAERLGLTVQQILDGDEEQDMDVAGAYAELEAERGTITDPHHIAWAADQFRPL